MAITPDSEAPAATTPPTPEMPPAGWYQNPAGPGRRYWDGSQWTDHVTGADTAQPAAAAPAVPAPSELRDLREAYAVNARWKLAYVVGLLCAGAVMVFLVFSFGGHSLDLARSSTKFVRPSLGFLLGPLLILIAMPRSRMGLRSREASPGQPPSSDLVEAVSVYRGGRLRNADRSLRVEYVYKRSLHTRLAVVVLLWIGGLANLIIGVASLGSEYTIKSGTYVVGAILCAGLASTLGMLPSGLRLIRVFKGGSSS